MNDDQARQAQELAARLQAEGHHGPAGQIRDAIGGLAVGAAVLQAVRDVCQFVLTAVEALDPKTALLAEELRLEIDKKLLP